MVVDPVSSISFRGVPMIEHESVDQFPVDDMQDCFQFGPENHLVPTLIDQVINPSVVNYSIGPTVFWGGRGSGKTMLVKVSGEGVNRTAVPVSAVSPTTCKGVSGTP